MSGRAPRAPHKEKLGQRENVQDPPDSTSQTIFLTRSVPTEFPEQHPERSLHSEGRWRRPRESAAPSQLQATAHGERRLGPRNHKPPGLRGSPEGLAPKPFTPAQAPRVSTFAFPERAKQVTQQPKAAPNLSAGPPGPPHRSCKAELRPAVTAGSGLGNKREGRTTGNGPAGPKAVPVPPELAHPKRPAPAAFTAGPLTRRPHRETNELTPVPIELILLKTGGTCRVHRAASAPAPPQPAGQ